MGCPPGRLVRPGTSPQRPPAGYFDVKCFDAQANACAQYVKPGREIAVDGRLLFDEFQTQDGSYASRIYIVAERVESLLLSHQSGHIPRLDRDCRSGRQPIVSKA